MTQFFCAEHARQTGVDIIGTASTHDCYIVIECAPPWTPYELESKGIPDDLRKLGEEIENDYDRFQTRFLLIHNENLKQDNLTRLLIFRKPSKLANAYSKHEFLLADIQEVAPLVKNYLMGNPIDELPVKTSTRDILICTHGSHDRCCSRFGSPLYHQALKIVEERSLNHIRIWQASHIGGHRMAPTAIDFPEARYYGYLDSSSLTSILTRTGDIQDLTTVYRGWGMLPWAAQVVEQELLLTHGWDWFNYNVTAQVLKHNEEETFNHIELTYQTSAGEQQTYHADVIADIDKTIYLRGSCNTKKESEITPYIVKNLTSAQAVERS
jgi:hypothetical protein